MLSRPLGHSVTLEMKRPLSGPSPTTLHLGVGPHVGFAGAASHFCIASQLVINERLMQGEVSAPLKQESRTFTDRTFERLLDRSVTGRPNSSSNSASKP
jgi:hypothetical protein